MLKHNINNFKYFHGGAIGSKLEPTSPLLQEIRLCP